MLERLDGTRSEEEDTKPDALLGFSLRLVRGVLDIDLRFSEKSLKARVRFRVDLHKIVCSIVDNGI